MIDMKDVGVRFQVGVLAQKQKETKEYTLSKMYTMLYFLKAKGLMYCVISDNCLHSKQWIDGVFNDVDSKHLQYYTRSVHASVKAERTYMFQYM